MHGQHKPLRRRPRLYGLYKRAKGTTDWEGPVFDYKAPLAKIRVAMQNVAFNLTITGWEVKFAPVPAKKSPTALAMESLGLTKAKGTWGGTVWE